MLKPLATITRTLLSLDGLWNFGIAESPDLDANRNWTQPIPYTTQVPVPASYNDILNNATIRDHLGWVYYQRETHVPRNWADERYFVRFDAITHHGKVFINDDLVAEHIGGYTPFEAELTNVVSPGEPFRITVAVDNELTFETIPPGYTEILDSGKKKLTYFHDFFNYAGIARSVWLYSVPRVFIDDVTVVTDVQGENTGIVDFEIATNGNATKSRVLLEDEDGQTVAETSKLNDTFTVESASLWQPGKAYLYQLRAELLSSEGTVLDTYTLPVGIRSIKVEGNQFLINNQPFYFTGFGKHEDTPVRGKGFDASYMVHDYELMTWIGANSYRTSHYPYAEEMLQYADRHGIVVIDETAAVGINMPLQGAPFDTYTPETINNNTQAALKQAVRELFARDKNHPSVVMWCIMNEPSAHEDGARDFFEPVVELARELDPSRPLTFANGGRPGVDEDTLTDMFDVIMINRYYGWYSETGDLEEAELALKAELGEWQKDGRPIIISEYGADTQAGLHTVLDVPWSEEFQSNFLDMYHRVFDEIDGVVGEHVWNFADFQTVSGIRRVDGNKKGIFTRERRPKSAAQLLRKRWTGRDNMGWIDGETKGGD